MIKTELLIELVPELRNTARCLSSLHSEQWDPTTHPEIITTTITNILDIAKNTETICKKYFENGKPGGEKILAHVSGPYRHAVSQLVVVLEKGSGEVKLVLPLFKAETKKLTEMAIAFSQVGTDTKNSNIPSENPEIPSDLISSFSPSDPHELAPPASAHKRRRSSPQPSPRSTSDFPIPSPPPPPGISSVNGHRWRSSSLMSTRNQTAPQVEMPALPRAPEVGGPPRHLPPPVPVSPPPTSPRKLTGTPPEIKKSLYCVEADARWPPVPAKGGHPQKKTPPRAPPVREIDTDLQYQCTCRIGDMRGKHDYEGLLIMSIFDNGLKLRVILTESLEEYSCTLKPSNYWTYDDLLDIFQKNKKGSFTLSHFSNHVRIVGYGLRETLSKVLRRSISLESMKQKQSIPLTSMTTSRKKSNKTRHVVDKPSKSSSTPCPEIQHDSRRTTSQSSGVPSPVKDNCNNGMFGISTSLGNITYNLSNDVDEEEDDDTDISLWDFLDSMKPRTTTLPSSQHFPKFSLCFCSISTSAYAFDIKKASLVACDVIGQWLEKHKDPRLKIFLVDITDSETLAKFHAESKRRSPPDGIPRFEIKTANLVKLKDCNIPCWYIVNASNPNFKGGGSGANKAIHRACKGEHTNLEKLTHKLYKPPAKVAKAYPVDLSDPCPLRDEQEVHCVIHVVGPNMSPKRPNYLKGDYEKGEALLRAAYEDVLAVFHQRISQYM